jgi:hypothetical protein
MVDYAVRFLEKNCRDGKKSGQEDETKNDN